MHAYTSETARLADEIVAYALERVRMEPPPLDGPRHADELRAAAGHTITPQGLGGSEALRLFRDVLAPATISVDHPRFLAFVPSAPTEAAILFDVVVAASSIYAGSWLEGAGAVFAENEALAWLASLADLPQGAGGVFVQGGTLGNLSAIVAARHAYLERHGGTRPARFRIAATEEAHSSIRTAARVLDVEVIPVHLSDDGRLTGDGLRRALVEHGTDGLFAVVATAGTTNLGRVDDLDGVADVAAEHGVWFHVDGAYGGAALCAPSVRGRFHGIERCDSFIVDPHKWLFAPFDACALVYRDPQAAMRAHTQHAGYLDVLHHGEPEWNPSDLAVHLSRRARGLPFWFSLATHGTDAYRDAVERTLAVTREAAEEIRARPELDLLLEPDLSVLVFRRHGWTPDEYQAWGERLLADQVAFVTPTKHLGETVARICIVNPKTTMDDIRLILDTMA